MGEITRILLKPVQGITVARALLEMWKLLLFASAVLAIGSSGEVDRGQGGGGHVHDLQKRDANSQLAFLSFAMALLNTIVNIISAVNNNNNNSNNNNNNNDNNNQNMNQNMNNVQSNNGRGLLESSVTAWLEEKVEESPGCVERFVCETYRTGQTLQGPAYY